MLLDHVKDMMEELNKCETALLFRSAYSSVYNLLLTIIINTDFRSLKKEGYELKPVYDGLNKVMDTFSFSPYYESHFEHLYLLEAGFLQESSFTEVYDEFHTTEDS